VRGYLDAGVNLVVERDFCHPTLRAETAELFAPFQAWIVGLRWDAAVLEAREVARTDGIAPGTAQRQTRHAGRWKMPYDLVVDSVGLAPADIALQVHRWLQARPEPRAIREIASSRS
jgi:chloramphenicol 3-O-phosphotransferase